MASVSTGNSLMSCNGRSRHSARPAHPISQAWSGRDFRAAFVIGPMRFSRSMPSTAATSRAKMPTGSLLVRRSVFLYRTANPRAGVPAIYELSLQKNSEHGAGALTEFVKIEKGLGPEGRIAVVRFDRGDGINARSPEALRQLTGAAGSFEDDGETSVVVLTGGPKAFSAGFDLKDAEGRERRSMDLGALRRHLKLGPRVTRAWPEMEQITIGAIEGFCVGGGVALAVALDFRVMAHDAHLRVPEIGLGMNMSWQSVPRMLHLIGPGRTKQRVTARHCAPRRRRGLAMGSGGGGGRSRQGLRRGDDARGKSRGTAPAVGCHDQTDRQSSGACARRSRRSYGPRPVRAGEFQRGPQGGRRGVPGAAQAEVQGALGAMRSVESCQVPAAAD